MLNPTEDSLALMMANSGYEVWIGNTRSSNYTYGHLTYTRKDKVSILQSTMLIFYIISHLICPWHQKLIEFVRGSTGILELELGRSRENRFAYNVATCL